MGTVLGPVPQPRRGTRTVRRHPDQHNEVTSGQLRPLPTPTLLSHQGSALSSSALSSSSSSPVQRRAAGGDDPLGGEAVPEAIETALRRRRGTGAPLPDSLAREMSTRFGMDLSGVRVHTDPEAARISQQLQAVAFTRGQDIYFGTGAYHPESTSGRELLGHELAHIVQQRSSTAPSGPGDVIGRADDPAERQADEIAAQVVQRSPSDLPPTPAGPDAGGGFRRPTDGSVIRRRKGSKHNRRDQRAAKLDGTLHESRPDPRPAPAEPEPEPDIEPVQGMERRAMAQLFASMLEIFGTPVFLSGGAALGWQGGRRPVGDLDFRVSAERAGFDDFDQPAGQVLLRFINEKMAPRFRNLPGLTSGSAIDEVHQIGSGKSLTIGSANWLGHEVSISVVRTPDRETTDLSAPGTAHPGLSGLSLVELRADKAKTLLTRTKRGQDSVKKVAQDLFDFLNASQLIDQQNPGAELTAGQHVDQALADRAGEYAGANLDGLNLHHLRPEQLLGLMRTRLVLTARAHLKGGQRADAFRQLLKDYPTPQSGKDPLQTRLQRVANLSVPAEEVTALRPWFAEWNDQSNFGPPSRSRRAKRPGVPARTQGDRSLDPEPTDVVQETPVDELLELHAADIEALIPAQSVLAKQVMRVLVLSGGFRRLGAVNDRSTMLAFGLWKSDFDAAFKDLRKAKLVTSHDDGLRLSGITSTSTGVTPDQAVAELRRHV